MVVAGHPEHGNDRALPLAFQHPSQGGGRERLVNGVERPGEQTGLLSGGDDEGAGLAQSRQRRFSGGRRDDGVRQRRIEVSLTRRRDLDSGHEWRWNNAKRHSTCPTRMVRGELEVSDVAS
jgi:hypothetical protein